MRTISAFQAFVFLMSASFLTPSLNASDYKKVIFEKTHAARHKAVTARRQHSRADCRSAQAEQKGNLAEQLQQVWVPDQTSPEKGAWVDSAKIVFSWNGDLDTSSDLYIIQPDGGWEHVEHIRATYTDKDSVNDVYAQKWVADSSKWLDYFKEMYTYDPVKGYMTQDYIQLNYQLFDPENADIQPAGLTDYEKDLYTYNADGQVVEIVIQEVLSANYTLADSRKTLFTYDANNNISRQNFKLMMRGNWVDTQQIQYIYNQKNQLVKDSVCNYRSNNSSWTPFLLEIYNYTPFDSLDTITAKRYRTLRWVDTLRNIFEYDANTHMESKSIFQQWGADSGKWVNISSDSTIYIGRDPQQFIYREYSGGKWVNISRVINNYGTSIMNVGGKKGKSRLSAALSILPHGVLRLSLDEPAVISAIVYDIRGNAIATLAEKKRFQKGIFKLLWNKTNQHGGALPAGVYFCKLKINNSEENKEMILVK